MKLLTLSMPVVLGVLLLASCGGGGGNPGICAGSAQVCADGGNSNTLSGETLALEPTPSTTTGSTTTSTDTAVCSQFLDQAAAQQYFFSHNAPQLDPDGDGIACNN
jgi:hypothetical protein